MRGFFVTFEGPEGCGKSTQAGMLAERLRRLGYEVVNTREPGGTGVGEKIRSILKDGRGSETIFAETEMFLFSASRAQLVRGVIIPALERGACVVCDRFADSTTAYQGYGRGLNVDRIVDINALALSGVVPDVTVLLDVEVELGVSRLRRRNIETNTGSDRIEMEDISFHERVRRCYLELAKKWPERFRVIDGRRNEDVVATDIWRIVKGTVESRLKGRAVKNG